MWMFQIAMVTQEPFCTRRAVVRLFSFGQEKAFQNKLAANSNNIQWLIETIKEGPPHHAREAMQSLAFWSAARTDLVLVSIVEEKMLPVLLDMLSNDPNWATRQHILSIFGSLVVHEEFVGEAVQHNVIGALVEMIAQKARVDLHSLGNVLLDMLKRSGAMVEAFVLCDGLEHIVKWVQKGDRTQQGIGLEIMLVVSEEGTEFRALMAVEGCAQVILEALDWSPAKCRVLASAVLSNLSYVHDVRPILIGVGTLRTLLKHLPGNCEMLTRYLITTLANLSVLPEARKRIRKLEGIPMVVKLLECGDTAAIDMSACTLANLAVEPAGQSLINDAGGISILGKLLDSDSRQMAALALGNLARSDPLREQIADVCGVQPFVDMLIDENEACREEALRVLVQLCMHDQAREDVITLGVPARLVELFSDDNPNIRRLAVHCLTTIAERIRICFSVFNEAAIVGIVNLLSDEDSGCRDQAASTLQWLVNDTPDIQLIALRHQALERLLVLMDDPLEGGNITDACAYSAICLCHISKHDKKITEEIAHAGVMPRLIDVVQDSNIEIKRIVMELIARLVDVPGQSQMLTDCGCVPKLIDLLTLEDERCKRAALSVLASCSSHGKVLDCIVENCHGPVKENRDDGNCENNVEPWPPVKTLKTPPKAEKCLPSCDDDGYEKKDTGLQSLAAWYCAKSMGDLLSDEEIHRVSQLPDRLLKAISQELGPANEWSSHPVDIPGEN